MGVEENGVKIVKIKDKDDEYVRGVYKIIIIKIENGWVEFFGWLFIYLCFL